MNIDTMIQKLQQNGIEATHSDLDGHICCLCCNKEKEIKKIGEVIKDTNYTYVGIEDYLHVIKLNEPNGDDQMKTLTQEAKAIFEQLRGKIMYTGSYDFGSDKKYPHHYQIIGKDVLDVTINEDFATIYHTPYLCDEIIKLFWEEQKENNNNDLETKIKNEAQTIYQQFKDDIVIAYSTDWEGWGITLRGGEYLTDYASEQQHEHDLKFNPDITEIYVIEKWCKEHIDTSSVQILLNFDHNHHPWVLTPKVRFVLNKIEKNEEITLQNILNFLPTTH